jgi:hypothetical protein
MGRHLTATLTFRSIASPCARSHLLVLFFLNKIQKNRAVGGHNYARCLSTMMLMMMMSSYVALCAVGMALLCFMCGGHSEVGPLERQHGQQLSSRYRPRRRYSPKGHTSRGRACLLRMLALMSLVGATHGFRPVDRTALKTAVEAWCTDESAATVTYGDINTWDVRTTLCTHSPCCPPHPRP